MDKVENWMKLGKTRRNNVKRISSLQDLCIAKVYKLLPVYTGKARHPFQHLSPKALAALMEGLDKLGNNSLRYAKDKVLEVFIALNCTTLHIWMERWYDFETENILKVIPKLGKNLVELRLEVIPEDYLPQLHRALRKLTKLQKLELSFRGSDMGDKTMQVIGSSMPELTFLKVDAGDITDRGITYLWKETAKSGKCKKLETIALMGGYDKVTMKGVLQGLENLPCLKFWDHKYTYEAILAYGKKHKKPLPNYLGYIKVPYDEEEEEEEEEEDEEDGKKAIVVTDENLGQYLTTVPTVAELLLKDTDIKCETICKAEKIDSLKLSGEFVTQPYVEKILKKLGSNLEELKLKSDHVIDISMIGYYCPNLKSLEWECKSPSSDVFKYDLKNQFKSILSFDINDHDFPVIVMKTMFTNEELQIAQIRDVACINERFLEDLLMLAYNDPRILSNITYIQLISKQVTFKTLSLLICVSPKLEDHLMGNTGMLYEERRLLNDFHESFDPNKYSTKW